MLYDLIMLVVDDICRNASMTLPGLWTGAIPVRNLSNILHQQQNGFYKHNKTRETSLRSQDSKDKG
jgi:hypothetical protein